MKKTFTVSDLPPSERPRERLVRFGPHALSVQELLALVVGRGVSGKPVMMLTQELLAAFGSLKALAEASSEDVQKVKGIGPAKAAQLAACFELARRLRSEEEEASRVTGKQVTSPADAAVLVRTSMKKDYKKEHFFVLSFDTRNHLIRMDAISTGILNANLVHPRETFEAAIRRHAAKIMIAHNHPSGDPEPSEDDLDITRRLADAGRLLGIELLDHLIVTETRFLSLREKGLMG